MKRIGAAVIAVCIFSALLCPFYAFAYDSRYVDELEKWSVNESAEWVEFQGENASGYMQYFYGDSCAYFHIFVQSPQFAENDDSLYITADVKNKNRNYNVQISENDVEEKAPCKIYKNLGSLPDGLRNITFALEFIDKEDKNYKNEITVSICAGGNCLAEIGGLEFGEDPQPKATKQSGAKQATAKKSTSAKSARSGKSANSAKSKSSSEKSTKFKYTETSEAASHGADANGGQIENAQAEENENGNQNSPAALEEKVSRLSGTAKALIAVAAAFAAFGTAFVIKAASAKKGEKASDSSELNKSGNSNSENKQ